MRLLRWKLLVLLATTAVAAAACRDSLAPDWLGTGSPTPTGTPTPEPPRGTLSFTDAAASAGVAIPGLKDAGVAWGDWNHDGWPDLLVLTRDAATPSRLFFNDATAPDPAFVNVTASNIPTLPQSFHYERTAIGADFDGDGLTDILANSGGEIAIWLNRGPDAVPAYSFGLDGSNAPNLTINTNDGLFVNAEGVMVVDYDRDGWLDVVSDNEPGFIVLHNPADGSADLSLADPGDTGLPAFGAENGDYAAAGDLDGDGWTDVLARKQIFADLWRGGPDGFAADAGFDFEASNDDKGGITLCDFDADGDLDLIWADFGIDLVGNADENEIQRNDGSGGFSGSNQPAGFPTAGVGSAACGDVDNDGDLDLFYARSGNDALYLNTSTNGVLSFQQSLVLASAGDGTLRGTAAAFADYDRDGDLDLHVSQDGPNVLWRNATNDRHYLMVRVLVPANASTTPPLRDDFGARVTLLDSAGNAVSGVREIQGGQGRGSSNHPTVHFGLPGSPYALWSVRVDFHGVDQVKTVDVIPGNIPDYQLLEVSPD